MEHNPDQPFNSNESNSSEFEHNPQKFEKTPFFKKNYNDESQPSNTYYKKPFSNEQKSSYNEQRSGYNEQKSSYNEQRSGYNEQRGGYNEQRGSYNKKPFNKTGQGDFKRPFVKRPEMIKEQRGKGAGEYFKLVPVVTEQRGLGAGTYTKKLNVPAGYNDNPDRKVAPRRENSAHQIVPVYTDAPILSNEREESEGMRVNKFIAHAGICARRKADEYIKSGRITINGEKMDQVGYRVKAEDSVEFDGKVIKPAKKYVYILLNKPRNVITTSDDEKGRKTVLDLVSPLTQERVYPVGRLDRDTTGLVLLTNDGELAQRLAHPSHNVKKIYEVTLDRPFTQEDMDKVRATIELADGPAPVDRIDFIKEAPANVVGIEIHLGRNRIVRRIFESLGYRVHRLDRVKYAMLTKKGVGRGFSRFLTTEEITMLKYLL